MERTLEICEPVDFGREKAEFVTESPFFVTFYFSFSNSNILYFSPNGRVWPLVRQMDCWSL